MAEFEKLVTKFHKHGFKLPDCEIESRPDEWVIRANGKTAFVSRGHCDVNALRAALLILENKK